MFLSTNKYKGPLECTGGLTQTQDLLTGSPAIDKGAAAGCTGAGASPITIDQRGFARPNGPTCDIGTVEYTPSTSLTFLPLVWK